MKTLTVMSALGRIQIAHGVLHAVTSAELYRMEKGPRDAINNAREALGLVLGPLAQADGDPTQIALPLPATPKCSHCGTPKPERVCWYCGEQ